jgi:hypothetical protein
VLADIRNAPGPFVPNIDSSEPGNIDNPLDGLGNSRITAIVVVGLLTIVSLVILFLRRITR